MRKLTDSVLRFGLQVIVMRGELKFGFSASVQPVISWLFPHTPVSVNFSTAAAYLLALFD